MRTGTITYTRGFGSQLHLPGNYLPIHYELVPPVNGAT